MSQVTLQGPLFGASPAAAAPNGVPGVIADPPPAVTQLASGHLLQGEVVGRNEQGQTLVKTELGTLAVTTKAQLPTGSQVTLQIRTAGAQIQIAVLQVDGHAPHLRGSGPAVAAATAQPAAAAPAASPAPRQVTDQVVRPSAGLPGTIADPPAGLAKLPPGTLLQGAVLGRDAAGHYLVRTEFGTLPLTTDVQLASGNRVSLRVTSVLPQVQVLVTPAEGPQAGTGGAARATGPVGTGPVAAGPVPAGINPTAGSQPGPMALRAAASPHTASTVDVLTLGQTVRALVISTAAPWSPGVQPAGAALLAGTALLPGAATDAVPGLPPLRAGAAIQLHIIQVTPPDLPPPGAKPSGQAGSSPSGAAQAGTGQTSPGAPAPPGGLPQQGPPPPAAGSVRLEGLVTGSTASGQPQVQTAAGLLTLQIGAQLPAGTRLALDLPTQQLAALTPPGVPGATPLALPAAGSDANSLAYSWPALQLALEGLERLDAAEARALLSQQGPTAPLPQPGPRLSSAMLFFINALTGGDPGAWLGELMGGHAQRRLERAGQGDLLARLRGDLGGLARLTDAAGESWRLLPIPLYDGQQLQQMRLFLRQRRDGSKGRGKDAEATRFLLEVSLTRLGDLQLDGLVRRKRFDLILRSRQSLPQPMRQDISAIFTAANEASGSEGSITFQDSPDWQPMPIGAAATGLVV